MTNRKKRLKRVIGSLQEQIKIHEEKMEKAEKEDMEDLVRYYIKEIEAKKKDLEKKEKALDK